MVYLEYVKDQVAKKIWFHAHKIPPLVRAEMASEIVDFVLASAAKKLNDGNPDNHE